MKRQTVKEIRAVGRRVPHRAMIAHAAVFTAVRSGCCGEAMHFTQCCSDMHTCSLQVFRA